MKHLVIVFRHAPHGTAHGREALDLAMLSASFEQQVSLVFVDEGVLHLLPSQNSDLIGSKDYIAAFGALELYDIEQVFACQYSAEFLSLNENDLAYGAKIYSPEAISHLFQQADEVLVF